MPSKCASGSSSARKSCCQTVQPLSARHGCEARGALEPDGRVPEPGEGREVAPGPAAEVEDPEGRRAFDVPQQRGDVLADVVIARAGAKVFGALFVVRQRAGGDLVQLRRLGLHMSKRPAELSST